MRETAGVGVDVGLEMAELETVGACLCGSVCFAIRGPLRDVLACHCSQCRKSSGHFWAATAAPRDAFTFQLDDGLSWFQSSEEVKRGFCRNCGSSLFWSHRGKDTLSVSAGVLEKPTNLIFGGHIYCDDAAGYYRVDVGEGVFETTSAGHADSQGSENT